MKISIFEIIMLLCFGAAWPFSIYKSYKSKTAKGKSGIFLFIVIVGYISGILHKLFYSFNFVIFFYSLNLFMVIIDLILFFRNKNFDRKNIEKLIE